MNLGWDKDFSYAYFKKIIATAKENFDVHRVCEVDIAIRKSFEKPQLILRHDVDVSLKKALAMAEIEKEMGVYSTYMVIVDSLLYSLDDLQSKNILRNIVDMGHEVGVHFSLSDEARKKGINMRFLTGEIDKVCMRLEDIIKASVLSVSFHRPVPEFLYTDLKIGKRINVYAKELMRWYLSDSKGAWRMGEPLPFLLRPKNNLLQLLIHPIWWDNISMKASDRLQYFFEEETSGKDKRFKQIFSDSLSRTVPAVVRSGLLN